MTDDAQEWRWVGEDGVQKAVTEEELIAELSSEALPHYTLVWKRRWLEWLPAMQVAELAWALPPGRAERGVKPRESASDAQPPAPPLYLYPVIKRRAARGPDSRPLEEVEIETIAASNPAEGELDSERAARRAYTDEDDGDTHVLPSRPPPAEPIYVGPHSPPASEAPGPTYDEHEIPHIPRPPASPTDLSAYARLSTDSDDTELRIPARRRSRRSLGTPVAIGVAAVAGVLSAVLVLRSCGGKTASPGEEASAATSASPAKSAEHAALAGPATTAAGVGLQKSEAPRKGPACSVVTPALRVADWAEPLVTPTLAAIPGSARVAVGYGQSDTYAIGVTIDPKTLDRDQVFREFRREKLVSVVPTSKTGRLRFEIVRQGHVLANARAVDAPVPFALGATPFSIARLGKKGEPEPIWSLAEADQSTLPRVVSVPNGYAVALRRGSKGGAVAVGYLDADGNKLSELVDVRSEATSAGTPALAVSEDALLLAFASRSGTGTPWSITAAWAKLGETPRKSVKLDLGGGGPSGDRMSPAVGALGGGRWLVQWTEGSAGNRMIRAQVFSKDLTPLTEPANLSPDGANAGQGIVWTSGDLATILFYVKNGKNYNELWGVSLECAR